MKRTLLPVLLVAAACATSAPVSTPTPAIATTPSTPAARNVFPDLDHERVTYHLDRFQGEKRAEFAASLERMREQAPMIREELRRRGMPEELVYLALIESGFQPQVRSLAEASGIWQLIPDTARRYGLRVDAEVDERNDPQKSTQAALSYLSYLYNRFGSWYLAAAAYNTGENRVARLMTEATGRESGTDADYYRIWPQLPGETRDFVPVITAAMRIGRDPARYGF